MSAGLSRKQYVVGLNPTRAAHFSLGKKMYRFVVLHVPCFDLGLTVHVIILFLVNTHMALLDERSTFCYKRLQ